jgi:DNA polymerase III epsilon subunit-like protein
MKEKKDWNFLSDIESLLKLNLEKKLKCIVFDTETTGIYHTKDHILELAAIEIV